MNQNEYLSRVDFSAPVEQLLEDVANKYDLGVYKSYSVIESGYEDCNIQLTTSKGKFLVKAFAKTRKQSEISRYIDIYHQVMSAGVNHPTHHPTVGGDLLYKNKSVKLVVMDFIQGRTYLDNDIPVTGIDLTKIVDQAVKIIAFNGEQ
mgnify:CR=1 FL=1